jgi:hypothetical protein
MILQACAIVFRPDTTFSRSMFAKQIGFFFLIVALFDTDVVVFVWWSEDLWASQTCLSISSVGFDVTN